MKSLVFLLSVGLILIGLNKNVSADDFVQGTAETVDVDLGASREASRTDDEVVKREEEAIKLDGLNVAQLKELREKAEKFTFQTEVNRMMKLIINSLYRNKEIFLRELISNASDALDKIRLLSLTDKEQLETNPELNIRIKADKEAGMLHITDTGIAMTHKDLIANLGTIAKSGTAEFLSKMQDASNTQEMNDMIGQFGVGFYSAFLVADKVIVTTKNNDDKQYIWESDSSSFTIVEDPRGDTLKRGTTISLLMKPEARDYLEQDTIKNLVRKYSQFINFPIYLWASHTEKVEEEEEDVVEETPTKDEEKKEDGDEEDAAVEEEKPKEKKTKKVDKTIWDWEILNDNKPLWTRKPNEVTDAEYDEFYKSLTKDTAAPLARVHFVAEGEVSFKALVYIPKIQPSESFNRYGTSTDQIKLFVRRVFITDEFTDLLPSYLRFLRGILDSDDLPLNVSRETLQQHKLIKVIRKKLIRKVLDIIKKLSKEDFMSFWKEYSTNVKLGVVEDPSNRARLAKLLHFHSSHTLETEDNKDNQLTSLGDYVSRMKQNQDRIYYMAGASKEEVANSPFVENLLRKGYEVLYLVEPVDEYCISALPDFEGKKFQNVAKEGFSLASAEGSAGRLQELKERFEPLLNWLSNNALKDQISKATISERLTDSPCALIASMFGWTGNMERLATANAHQKSDDVQKNHYMHQKKQLEINPRHPLIKELLRRVKDDSNDPTAIDMALMLHRTATLRSGFQLHDTLDFAKSIEVMMRKTLGVSVDEPVEEEEDLGSDAAGSNEDQEEVDAEEGEHDEL